jgi:hypothetical protein
VLVTKIRDNINIKDMPFFARPNLDNTQFKQLPDSLLTLSGQTQIVTTSGLTLSDGIGGNVIITADGAQTKVNEVLTMYDGKIQLRPSGAGGDAYYNPPYKSPSSVNLCGITVGYVLTGKTIACILQDMLVPTISPNLTANSISLSLSPTDAIFEVESLISFTATASYNQGSVSPVYCCGTNVRTGAVNSYTFRNIDNMEYTGLLSSCALPIAPIQYGNQTICVCASYDAGLAPLMSDGTPMAGVTCPAGTKSTSRNITGVYPYFWGKSSSVPIPNQALIDSRSGKCVASSAADVIVSNFNATGEYLWFAIPNGVSKTKWQGANNPSNNGVIPGGLFPAPTIVEVNSPDSYWAYVDYQIYISNYATNVNYGMTFSN